MPPIVALIGAALIGGLVGAGPAIDTGALAPSHGDTITGCRAIDGDTLRCGAERIRLLGIDTAELPGHCRSGRDCAPGDPYAATTSLAEAALGELRIERVGEDHYGRTLAILSGSKGDLSCWQLRQGHALYKSRWDNGMRVARACPGSALR